MSLEVEPTKEAQTEVLKYYLEHSILKFWEVAISCKKVEKGRFPRVLLERNYQSLEQRKSIIAGICQELECDPLKEVVAIGEKIREELKTRMFLIAIDQSQIPLFLEVMEELKEREILFPKPTEEIRNLISERITERIKLPNRDLCYLERKEIKPGVWEKISKETVIESQEFLDEAMGFYLPLESGRNARIYLRTKGLFEPVNEEPPDPDFYTAFPLANPLMAETNIVKSAKDFTVFKTHYPRVSAPHLEFSFERYQKLIPKKISQSYLGLPENIPAREEIAQKLSSSQSLQTTLENLYHFVRAHASREEIDDDFAFNPRFLFQKFIQEGKFPGDCKSLSTITTTLARSLGLTSRMVQGLILETLGIVAGHTWTEVLIPERKESYFWVPVDPSGGAFINYPKDYLYRVAGYLPYFTQPEDVSLKVEFC